MALVRKPNNKKETLTGHKQPVATAPKPSAPKNTAPNNKKETLTGHKQPTSPVSAPKATTSSPKTQQKPTAPTLPATPKLPETIFKAPEFKNPFTAIPNTTVTPKKLPDDKPNHKKETMVGHKQTEVKRTDVLKAVKSVDVLDDIRDVYDADRFTTDKERIDAVSATTKYSVATVDVLSYDEVSKGIESGTMEMWYLNDSNDLAKVTNYSQEIKEIGRRRLQGVDDSDKIVFYDNATGKLYKFSEVSSEFTKAKEYTDLYRKVMDETTTSTQLSLAEYEGQLKTLDAQLQTYVTKAETEGPLSNEDYKAYQDIVAQYNEVIGQYNKKYDKYKTSYGNLNKAYIEHKTEQDSYGMTIEEYSTYKALQQKASSTDFIPGTTIQKNPLTKGEAAALAELQKRVDTNTTLYMDGTWFEKLNEYASNVETLRNNYEESSKYYAQVYSNDQVNSFRDVVVNAYQRLTQSNSFSEQLKGFGKDAASVLDYTLAKPIEYFKDNTSSVNEIKNITSTEEEVTKLTYAKAYAKITADSLGIMLNNFLVGLEVADITNVFKPYLVGSNLYKEMHNGNTQLDPYVLENTNMEEIYLKTEDYLANIDEIHKEKTKWLRSNPFSGKEVAEYTPLTETEKLQEAMRYAGKLATEDAWGINGTTPSYEYDYMFRDEDENLKTMAASVFLDILFDPGSYFALAKKAIPEGMTKTADKLTAIVEDTLRRSGIVVDRKVITDMSGRIMNQSLLEKIPVEKAFYQQVYSVLKELGTDSTSVKEAIKHLDVSVAKKFNNHFDALADVLSMQTKEAAKALPETLGVSYKIMNAVKATITVGDFMDQLISYAALPVWHAGKGVWKAGHKAFKVLDSIGDAATAKHIAAVTERIANKTDVPVNALNIQKIIDSTLQEVYSVKGLANSRVVAEFGADTISHLVRAVDEQEFKVIREVMSSHTPITQKLKELDEFAVKFSDNKYSNFKEYFTDIIKTKKVYADTLNGQIVSSIRWIKYKYNSLLAASKLADWQQVVTSSDRSAKVLKESVQNVLGDSVNPSAIQYHYKSLSNALYSAERSVVDGMTNITTSDMRQLVNRAQDSLDAYMSKPNIKTREAVASAVQDVQEMLSLQQTFAQSKTNLYMMRAHRSPIANEIPELVPVNNVSHVQEEYVAGLFTNALNKKYDLNLSIDQVQQAAFRQLEDLLDAEGKIDFTQLTRMYHVQLDKLTKMYSLANDEIITKIAGDFMSNESTVPEALYMLYNRVDELQDVAEAARIKELTDRLKQNLCSVTTTRNFIDNIEQLKQADIPEKHVNAFLDALAGDGDYINDIFENMSKADFYDIDKAAMRITQRIYDDATKFYTYLSDVSDIRLNKMEAHTANTYENIKRTQNYLDEVITINGESKTVRQFLEDTVPVDKDYLDVHFSLARVNYAADPAMISFSIGEEIRTFRNLDDNFVPLPSETYSIYGKELDDCVSDFTAGAEHAKAYNTQQYAVAINDYIMQLKAQAAEQGKTLRFVGFNSSPSGSNQEMFLRKLMWENNISVDTSNVVDIGNFYRAAKGHDVISRDAFDQLRSAVRHSLDYSVATTMDYRVRNAKILLNNSYDYMKDAHQLSELLIQYQDLFSNPMAKIGLDNTRILLDDLQKAWTVYKQPFSAAENAISDVLIDEHAITELLNKEFKNRNKILRINCMQLIRESIENSGKFNYNLRTEINRHHILNWFDLDKLSSASLDGVKHTVDRLEKLRDITNELDTFYNRIALPEALQEVGEDSFKTLYNILAAQYGPKVFINNPELAIIHDALNISGAEQWYCMAKYAYDAVITSNPQKAKAISGFISAADDSKLRSAHLLVTPGGSGKYVFNDGGIIRVDIDSTVAASKYASSVSDFNLQQSMRQYFDWSYGKVEDFDMYLSSIDSISEASSVYSGVERIHTELFSEVNNVYKEFIGSINGLYSGMAKQKNIEDFVTAMYNSDNMVYAKDIVSFVNNERSSIAVKTVLSLSDEDLAQHVIRNCANCLVIDPKAKMFQEYDLSSLLYRRLDGLLDSKELSVIKGEDGLIRVFKDMSELTGDEMDAFLKLHTDAPTFNFATLQVEQIKKTIRSLENKINNNTAAPMLRDQIHALEAYNKYLEAMNKHMPDSYSVSCFETLTQDTVQRMYAGIPEASRLDLGLANSWFDNMFNCSIIGDANTYKQFNEYYSDNLLANMGMGIQHVRNTLEATSNYMAMYTSPMQSLGYMVERAGLTNLSYKDINKAIEHNGYVLHTADFKNGKWTVKKLNMQSNFELKKYLSNPNVICTPNEVFMEIRDYAKGLNKKWKIEHANQFKLNTMEVLNKYERTVKSAYITEWLFVNWLGPAVRNASDALTKAYNQTASIGKLAYYVGNASEMNSRFNNIVANIVETYGDCNAQTIARYYKNVQGQSLSMREFMKLYTINSSSAAGLTTVFDTKRALRIEKLRSMLPHGLEISDDVFKEAIRRYQKVNKKYIDMPIKPRAKMVEEAAQLIEQMDVDEATKQFLIKGYSHTASDSFTAMEAIQKVPLLGNYIQHNIDNFSGVETNIRNSMALYYMDEYGYTANRANIEVIKTQFNYNSRSQIVEGIEKLFPFSTYKIYNMGYWFNEASKHYGVYKNLRRVAEHTSMGYLDDKEQMNLIQNQILRQKIADGSIGLDERGMLDENDLAEMPGLLTGLAGSVVDVINNYQGVPVNLLESGIRIGKNHVIKIGNSFIENMNLLHGIVLAPLELANGQVPTILADNIFSPVSTLLGAFKAYRSGTLLKFNGYSNYEWNDFYTWLSDNYYDVIDLVPFVGGLINLTITHLKNGHANFEDLRTMALLPELQDEFVYTTFEGALDFLGMIMPSVVGITTDKADYYSRPIGENWYSQDDEYKKSHRFVLGVSYLPSILNKSPSNYVDYFGMYKKMGYNDEEVLKLLEFLFGRDEKGNMLYEKPGMYQYDRALINQTLETLVSKGYSAEEAIELIMSGTKWVMPDGTIRNDAELMSDLMDSVFLKMYEIVPDYIKYDKPQYKALKDYYKALGYDTHQIWDLMQNAGGFIDEEGMYRTLTPKQVEEYNFQINTDFLDLQKDLPDWYKYEPGAVQRAIKALTNSGMTLDQAYEYIKKNRLYIDEDGRSYIFSEQESIRMTALKSQEFKEYYSQLPDYIKYEKGAYSRTLQYLKDTGLTSEEAKKLIMQGAYLTPDGRLINCSALTRPRKEFVPFEKETNEQFLAWYGTLPEYLRFEKGAYSRTYAYLKAQGFKYMQIRDMIKNGAYLTTDGKLINCTGMTRPRRFNYYSNRYYNNYRRRSYQKKSYQKRAPRPRRFGKPKIKKGFVRMPYRARGGNYSSTYSKVNVLAGSSYGYRAAFKVDISKNPVRRSLKSAYPAAYRNIKYAYRRSLYKEQYAKYGTSRMLMRANQIGYSNASVTRLRRNEIYNRGKYQNKRNRF